MQDQPIYAVDPYEEYEDPAHLVALQGVAAYGAVERLFCCPSRVDVRAQFLTALRASIPESMRSTIDRIATHGLCPQAGEISTDEVLELLRHPEALREMHLAIAMSGSPYWFDFDPNREPVSTPGPARRRRGHIRDSVNGSRRKFVRAVTAGTAALSASVVLGAGGFAFGHARGDRSGFRRGRSAVLAEMRVLTGQLGLDRPVVGGVAVKNANTIVFMVDVDTRSVQSVRFLPHPDAAPVVIYQGPPLPPSSLDAASVFKTREYSYQRLTGERVTLAADVSYYPGLERYAPKPPIAPRVLLLAPNGISLDPPDQVDFEQFWSDFVVKNGGFAPTTAVLGSADLQLPDEEKTDSKAKDYVGARDARALGIFMHLLFAQGAPVEGVQVLTAGELRGTRILAPEILIGGPSINSRFLPLVGQVHELADPKDSRALKRGFRFVVRPSAERLTNAYVRISDKDTSSGSWVMGIEDVETAELCEVRGLGDPATATDAAVVIRADLGGRPLLVVSGFEQTGTLAAVKAISEPGPIISRFNQVYRQNGYAEMVIRAQRGTSKPELFEFPSAQNPR